MEKTKALDILANDADCWMSPDNRIVGRVIISLRSDGIADEVIYKVVFAIIDAQDREGTRPPGANVERTIQVAWTQARER